MKAFLLAAGNGTRLRPLTDTIPKCLVPVRGVPMLSHWLDFCRRAQVNEVLINLHSKADQVRAWLTANSGDLNVTVFEEASLLGSAGTLRANRSWIGSDRDFWVFYADVLTNMDPATMLKFHRERARSATLGVYTVDEPSRCGIVETGPDQRILGFQEKPEHPRGNLAFAGILIGSQQLMDAIPNRPVVDIGADVLPNLVGNSYAYPIPGYVLDIGTVANYRRAQGTWPGVQQAGTCHE